MISAAYSAASGDRDDEDIGAPLKPLPVLNLPAGPGEQRMIFPHGDIGARVDFRAALPDQYIPWKDNFAAIALYAETLTMGVASVAR